MHHEKYTLPEYPVTTDVWDMIAASQKPIVVYGMGNGADKLIGRFEKYNIEISDFFASDGFVRGHYFHGMRVKSFSEIKEAYSDFVIVLSFASNREEVLAMLQQIDAEYDMYIPDMPVAGEDYFDKEFYNSHYDEILRAYNSLDDDSSKNMFAAIVNYKLTGRMSYLMNAYVTKDDLYRELNQASTIRMIDAGAYNGDTVREAEQYFRGLKEVIAIEPDPRNYKKLEKYAEQSSVKVRAINAAVWNEVGDGELMSAGNRNSSISSTSSYKHRDTDVSLISIDSLSISVDFIKYDVEGAELQALMGSANTINRCHPAMLVSLYHRSGDIFEIINYLRREYPFYKMYLRRLRCVPAWEIDLLLFDT